MACHSCPSVTANLTRMLCISVLFLVFCGAHGNGPADFVNVFVGTGGQAFGIGSTPPGPQMPFGAMRLSPDTAFDGIALIWEHFGGYYYYDNEILCFSHTHMMGAGVEDYGNIGVMPVREVSDKTVENDNYRSSFSHKTEYALPGYYTVHLDSPQVKAELTVAGNWTGVHRYTFEGDEKRYIIMDALHAVKKGAAVNGSISCNSTTGEVSGWTLLKGSLTGRNGHGIFVYFVATFDAHPAEYGVWENGHLKPGQASVHSGGSTAAAYYGFSDSVEQVTVVVAISFVSIEQARLNLRSEWKGEAFDVCQKQATTIWDSVLNQVYMETSNDNTLVNFYTSLYHSFTPPTQFSETNGQYMGMDNKVHTAAPGHRRFSDLSLWDIHRTQTPLLSLLQPSVALDIVLSLVDMYREGGALPRWPIANVFSGCMIGNHGYQVILDAYVKGIQAFDTQTALLAMYQEATNPHLKYDARSCLTDYINLGYCPKESDGHSVSLTLSYAFDDWALGSFADLLGNTSVAKLMLNRSTNYRNVWDHSKQFMCERSRDGKFSCPLDPYFNTWMFEEDGFTEGDAAQWRWFVPHDVPGLISLFQSQEHFVEELDKFFAKSEEHKSNFLPNPYYWAGNEPDLLAVYLFCYAGRADLTQKYVRWLLDNKYTVNPDGISGNDDYGTMSAWYVWGALGLYPLTGTTQYFVGSPAVDKATIALPKGTLNVIAWNNSDSNTHVQKATINGKVIDLVGHPFIGHKDIASGGVLEFWMQLP